MHVAGISDVDLTTLDAVIRSAISRATVDGVLVVEASASRVNLHDLVTHGEGDWWKSKVV